MIVTSDVSSDCSDSISSSGIFCTLTGKTKNGGAVTGGKVASSSSSSTFPILEAAATSVFSISLLLSILLTLFALFCKLLASSLSSSNIFSVVSLISCNIPELANTSGEALG